MITEDEFAESHERRDKEMMFLVERIGKLVLALRTIAEMPMPDQDDTLSASMRKIAIDAIEPTGQEAGMSILSDRKDGAGYYYGRREGDYRQINVRLGPVDLCWRAWVGDDRIGDVFESKDSAEAAAIAWAEANPPEGE